MCAILFSAIQNANASRIVFGKDGMLYMTVGIGDPPAAARAQDPNDLAGKVLRPARTTGPCLRTIPSSDALDTGPRFTRWAIATHWVWRVQPDTRRHLGMRGWFPNGGDEIKHL